jgi:hypothetical protein
MNPLRGVNPESIFAVFGAGGWNLWPMKLTQKPMAANRAMKISRLQPARRPSSPMKILRSLDGGVGGIDSAGIGVASSLNGFLV